MSLLSELQRRKVFKVAAAYAVVGWAVVEVSATVAPQLQFPEWVPRLITFVILLGFPIALVMAWVFDVTPEGIKVDTSGAGNKRVIAAAAVLAALALAWYLYRPAPAVPSHGDLRSIAVLPFVNMSRDRDNEYFSDGISEEILNVLARTPDLRVAARTSSFSFKDKTTEVPMIAHELNVRMVLEGSVRKQGDRVRITAQLIDASNGYHVWSQTYDRELKDIFAIQDEIANAIAAELDVKLHAKRQAIPAADTENLEAYDHYLKGIGLWQARGDQNLRDAVAHFRAALALDPNYAKAWAGLALADAILPEWAGVPIATAYPEGRDAAEHAIALDGDLPESYAALGYMASNETRFATSRAMFRRAIALAPSYATGYQWSGETLAGQGEWDEAIKMARKATELDPKSPIVGSVVASMLVTAGHDDEGLAYCDTIVGVSREWCPLLRYDVAMSRKDYAKARAALAPAAAARGPEAARLFQAQMDALEGKGDIDALGRQLLDLPNGMEDAKGLTPMSTTDLLYWYLAAGRNDLAIERFARYAKQVPYVARQIAYDKHYAVLHCEPAFLDILRSLKVEEPNLGAACVRAQ